MGAAQASYINEVEANNSVGTGNVLFDIDFGMSDLDSWLNLYNSAGALIGQHDDGSCCDAGSSSGWDSHWLVWA